MRSQAAPGRARRRGPARSARRPRRRPGARAAAAEARPSRCSRARRRPGGPSARSSSSTSAVERSPAWSTRSADRMRSRHASGIARDPRGRWVSATTAIRISACYAPCGTFLRLSTLGRIPEVQEGPCRTHRRAVSRPAHPRSLVREKPPHRRRPLWRVTVGRTAPQARVPKRDGKPRRATNGAAPSDAALQDLLEALIAARKGDFSQRMSIRQKGADARHRDELQRADRRAGARDEGARAPREDHRPRGPHDRARRRAGRERRVGRGARVRQRPDRRPRPAHHRDRARHGRRRRRRPDARRCS